MSGSAALAASGTLALRQRHARGGMLARVLGLYIAGAAGSIQLLDIVVDRAGLPDRVFAFVIVIAIIGLPGAAAAALLFDIAASDRRRPFRATSTASRASHESTRAAGARPIAAQFDPALPSAAPAVARDADGVSSAATPDRASAAPIGDDPLTALPQQLELALSHHRIAQLLRAAGNDDDARGHDDRFTGDVARIIAELQALLEDARA